MNKDSSDKIIRNVLALSGSFVAFASLYLAYSLYFGFALTTVKFYSFRLYLFIFIFEYLFSTAFTGVNRSFIFRGVFKEFIAVVQLTCFLISLLILTRVSQIKNLSKSRSTLGLMLFKNLY